jgi:DNA-binding HxlR family transcriptional regulator
VRTYGQYCSLAKALDVVGDRWSLLIVRELLTRGPIRYTDIHKGVPGIATNLLAERLRGLEQEGVIAREEAPPPIAATLFQLTPRGEDLRPVVLALGRWGAPLLPQASEEDEFQTHWISLPLEVYLADHRPEAPPVAIEVRTGDEPLVIEAKEGTVTTRVGTVEHPDGTLTGPPRLVMGVLAGRLSVEQARGAGLRFDGDLDALARVQPHALAPA